MKKYLVLLVFIIMTVGLFFAFSSFNNKWDALFVSYIVNPKRQDLKFYLKDEKQQNFKSIKNLKTFIESKNQKLLFAMNGGMYQKDNSPQGLYIENFKTVSEIDTKIVSGNFYLMPNGIFYITKDNNPAIVKTADFVASKDIKYAMQSGPMLLIDGKIHDSFNENSSNLNIRNGVGMLPDNSVLFAISKDPINFYDFANFFKSKGCVNALYLDGLVSRMYLPEKKWFQLDGNFGVIIGVTAKK